MNPPRRWLLMAASVAALQVAVHQAVAQSYPSRPVTMIVPASAGGPTDAIARVLSERMSANLGGTVLVDNVAGAGRALGVRQNARPPAPGPTPRLGPRGPPLVDSAPPTPPQQLFCALPPP